MLQNSKLRNLVNPWSFAVALIAALVLGVMVWQAVEWGGNPPDPSEASNLSPASAILNSGILVFREGLEAILVLSAITAGLMRNKGGFWKPVATGAGVGFAATIATWFIVVAIISAVNAPALDVQAATGLLAILVLLVVMNWFFHKIYWTGWIGMHHRRRRQVMERSGGALSGAFWGLALLGFSAIYREGFEVVLFLQNLRLKVGSEEVLLGTAVGLGLTLGVAVLTFSMQHKLPYKKMLIVTGVMLGLVLVVMVGESVQEMQLAHWLPTTTLPIPIPGWMGMWFAVFPTLEGLLAQAVAALLVIGSYLGAEYARVWRPRQKAREEGREMTLRQSTREA